MEAPHNWSFAVIKRWSCCNRDCRLSKSPVEWAWTGVACVGGKPPTANKVAVAFRPSPRRVDRHD